eukprot:CAMPEP_0184684896 /NCGR_PEP_ID=MMETSP0312-20130426/17052_1 /TAXON_ID=31354 /ORGANISM="Compsopogon coeruleus, Strain SAG 36.94" /LENGTH=253 /DNA_ID=CAMNT_0027138519 /DNA_START=8 /DNA_END=769 /DNA_ORIENTATION=+
MVVSISLFVAFLCLTYAQTCRGYDRCSPIPSCVDAGYNITTPQEYRAQLYNAIGPCDGTFGRTPTRCLNFVNLASLSLAKDATGKHCQTSESVQNVFRAAGVVLPRFPLIAPYRGNLFQYVEEQKSNTSAVRFQQNRRNSMSEERPQGSILSQRAVVNMSLVETSFMNVLLQYGGSWRSFSWNGWKLEQCREFPTGRNGLGSVAYPECANLVCTSLGMMPNESISAMLDCCAKKNIQEFYCFDDQIVSYRSIY